MIVKKLGQYGYNITAIMGDNNSDFSTRNKTSKYGGVMCFITVSTIDLMIINNIYISILIIHANGLH